MASQQLKVCFKVLFKVALILMGILPQVVVNTCELGHYILQGQHGIKCIDCVTCPHMLGATVPCNTVVYPDTNIACIKCNQGKTFSSGNDEKMCQPCKSSTCHRNEVVVGMCTLKDDNTQCNGTCVKGYYWSKNPTEPCQPCKNITCHCNEVVVGMCSPKEDNTRCNGTCVKGYYWSKNHAEPCQPCKNITCHRNEVVVGTCTPKEDNTQCNGTCVKGYYWSKNLTEPCQLLYHLFTPPVMTDGGQLSDESHLLVIMIVVLFIGLFIALIIIIILVRWHLKKVRQLTSKYEPCRKIDDVEPGGSSRTDITNVSLNDESTNANNVELGDITCASLNDESENANNEAEDIQLNNSGIQESELPSKYPDLPLEDISVDQSSFTKNVGLDSNDRASASLSTPGSTPTFKHEPSSFIELDLRRNLLSRKLSVPFTGCKVETHRIDNMNPKIYRKLCQLLDLYLTVGDDYNALGSYLGYVKIDMDIAGNQKKETTMEVLLSSWGKKSTGNTVLALARIVREKMKRFDVLEQLEDELKLQRKKCDCGSCPQIPSYGEKPDAL